MLEEVKKCVDSNDIKGLHYIFVDCLDVDPTFEKYAADFEYCKNIQGFLVSHTNMTPIMSREQWNKQYWEQLKLDLMKNFSEERFAHMREVARIIYADKINRLKQERGKNTVKHVETIQKPVVEVPVKPELQKAVISENTKHDGAPFILDADRQQRELLEKKEALELHNQKVENEQKEQRARIEAAKLANADRQPSKKNTQTSKKTMGVAMAVLAVVAIIVVVVLIQVL